MPCMLRFGRDTEASNHCPAAGNIERTMVPRTNRLSTNRPLHFSIWFTLVGSKTRTYHGWVETGWRAAGRRGGRGRVGRRRVCPPRRQASSTFFTRWKNNLLGAPLEARTKETLCKPMEEQKPHLTRGLSAGLRSLFVPGC